MKGTTNDLTGELLTAVVAAPRDRKKTALRVLRGEGAETAEGPAKGSLLLGMGDGAKLLGVSRSTFWRVLQAGTIEKVELLPGSYRVRRKDLEALARGKFSFGEKRSRRGRPKKEVSACVGVDGSGNEG
jgi:excisionase family DNA binding protein